MPARVGGHARRAGVSSAAIERADESGRRLSSWPSLIAVVPSSVSAPRRRWPADSLARAGSARRSATERDDAVRGAARGLELRGDGGEAVPPQDVRDLDEAVAARDEHAEQVEVRVGVHRAPSAARRNVGADVRATGPGVPSEVSERNGRRGDRAGALVRDEQAVAVDRVVPRPGAAGHRGVDGHRHVVLAEPRAARCGRCRASPAVRRVPASVRPAAWSPRVGSAVVGTEATHPRARRRRARGCGRRARRAAGPRRRGGAAGRAVRCPAGARSRRRRRSRPPPAGRAGPGPCRGPRRAAGRPDLEAAVGVRAVLSGVRAVGRRMRGRERTTRLRAVPRRPGRATLTTPSA